MSWLEVTARVKFSSPEEARQAGQAVEAVLKDRTGLLDIKLYDFEGNPKSSSKLPRRVNLSLHTIIPDRSRVTRGKQDMEARLISLIKNIRLAIPDLPEDADLTKEALVLSHQQWGVSYQQVFDNIGLVMDKAEVKDAFTDAVAKTLQTEATRGLK